MSNKLNSSKRRRLGIFFARVSLAIKIFSVCLLLSVITLDYFSNFRNECKNHLLDFTKNNGFAFKKLIIEGQVNIETKEILKSIGARRGDSIFSIDLNQVQNLLDKNTWVDSSIIQRRFPETIFISLKERIPVAIWQSQSKLYLIDEDGKIIIKYNQKGFEDLIQVVGEDANNYASSLRKSLDKYPDLQKKVKSAQRYGLRRWDLNFVDNIKVKMPENDFELAYDYLNLLNQKAKLFGHCYKTIDLRDHTKYYIEKH